jgi:PAS domain S-box-containing protein
MSQKTKRPVSEILEMAPLIARVEEARTVGGLPPLNIDPDVAKDDLLEELCLRLADDLENNSRRLIQTSVQLLGLREVAASAVALPNPEEISGHIATYLRKAFGFQQVVLLGADNDEGALRGIWMTDANGSRDVVPLRVPLDQHDSVLLSVFYSDTPSLVEDPSAFPLFGGIASTLGASPDLVDSYALVPLVGGRGTSGPWGGADTDAGRGPYESTRAVGVLGIAAGPDGEKLGPEDLSHLESIAPGVASALETALLTMDLRRNERFTANVLDSMSSGLVAVDLDGRIMIFNKMAEKLTGWSADEAIGMALETVLPERDGASHVLTTLEEGSEFTRAETTFCLRDGGEIPVSLATFLIMDEGADPIGAVGTFVDLTPLKKMEEKVRQLDRLATLGKFTSAVAHEIRNPLAGIAAGAQYIGKSMAEDDPQQENLKFVLEEINRLNRIISDLFTITHPHQPLLQPQNLDPVLQRSLRTVGELARVAGCTLEVDVPEHLPEVEMDADQMEQVLINLLKNGAEASGQGGTVELKVTLGTGKLRDDGPEEPYLQISVLDSGPGISEEDELRIFEPFFSTKDGGTGLGLYVSKGIVERHGGVLSVHTGAGGCAFTIKLPLKTSSEEESGK